ncbi:hypothetical protein Tco_1442755, partial [Tanacetum coccineum]
VDVSEESKPEPAKKRTSSKRRVKKKVTISAEDNIITKDPYVALELGKSISITKAKEEAARKVHATHARIVTETVPKPTRRKPSKEQEAANTIKSLKESRRTNRRQPGTKGSGEGTGSIPGVLDESRVVSATSSEGTDDDNDDVEKDDKDGDVDDEGDNHISDTKDADDEDVETKSDKDEIYKYKICVRKDEDEEMLNVEVANSDKGNEEVTDAAKADAEKTSEVKDDAKKTKLTPISSSLFISSGFGDHFLKLSFDSSLVSTVKDSTDAEINSLLEVKIQSEVPHIQSRSMLRVPISMIAKPSVVTPVQETPLEALVTTLPPSFVSTTPPVPQQSTTPIPTPTITTNAPIITTVVLESNALSAVQLRVTNLEKDASKLKNIDLSAAALATLKSQVLTVVDSYLDSKHFPELTKKQTPTVDLEQESEKSPSDILKIKREQAEKQKKMPKFTIKSTDKAALKECDLKSALYQTMHANKSFNKNLVNHKLYHALMEALIENENEIDKGVIDIVKDHKRKHDDDDDDEGPLTGPNKGKQTKKRRTKELESSKKSSTTKETPKGKALSKGPKTDKSALANEPVEEPIAEVVMEDTGDNVVRDDDQPQDTSEPKKATTLNPKWFKQPPRPPTPNLEWNKCQVVLGQPEQSWFN